MSESPKPEQPSDDQSSSNVPVPPAEPQQPTYRPNRLNGGAPQTEGPQDPQDFLEQRELNSARTLATIATIGGPVSFIIGGIALSSVALVCALIAFFKTRRVLANTDSKFAAYGRALRQTALMGIIISAAALVLNIVGVVAMMPLIMDAVQSGDYSSLLGTGTGGGTNGTPAPAAPGESAWG